MLKAVIMAGGKGERFWPKSRQSLPKQFLSLTNEKTMIQNSIERLSPIISSEDVYIATGEAYSELVKKQLPDVPRDNVLLEPVGRNTAACIGLAAIYIERDYPDVVMAVLPSDHLIRDNQRFIDVLKAAVEKAENEDALVTIGIEPTHPETGYGYIHYGSKDSEINDMPVFKVKEFVEKPNLELAKEYLSKGTYLWNSGMFVWKVSTIRKMIKEYMPELHQALEIIKKAMGTELEKKILYSEYSKLESISVDYGIMEKADSIYVIPGDFGWDDVGSWTALERVYEKDDNNNVLKGNIVDLDTENCIVIGEDKLIGTIGVKDLIIVQTEDATLICNKNDAQKVKELLKIIKEKKLEKYL